MIEVELTSLILNDEPSESEGPSNIKVRMMFPETWIWATQNKLIYSISPN